MLDRGEQLGWFDSNEIIVELLISVAGFYFFLAHSLTTATPFVRFELFKDRNFVAGCLFMVVIGVVLFGTMALVTPFMQNVIGYPILTAGLPAGRARRRHAGRDDRRRPAAEARSRRAISCSPALCFASFTLYQMVDFTDQTSAQTIVTAGVLQGFGLGLVFVPLSTVAFTTLPGHLRTDGTSILTLVRNIGSSIGISMVIAQLTSTTTRMHANLAEHITPFNNALAMPDVRTILDTATDTGRAMLEQILMQQAAIIAYANDFKLLMWLTLATMPLVFFIGSSRAAKPPAGKNEPARALD